MASAAAGPSTELLVGSGGLTYTWQGSTALGCSPDGLCNVDGVLAIAIGGATYSKGVLKVTGDVTARTAGPQAAMACVDLAGPEEFQFAVAPGAGTHVVRMSLADDVPSSGRCAGPLQSDVVRLPLTVTETAGSSPSFTLNADESTSAGPFALHLDADASLHLGDGGGGFTSIFGGGASGGSSGPRSTIERAEVRYRAAPSSTPLVASFHSAPDPFCQPLGSCGATGTIAVSVVAGAPPLSLTLTRPVYGRPAQVNVVHDLAAGKLIGGGSGRLMIKVSESVAESGGVSCASSQIESLPVTLVSTTSGGEAVQLSIGGSTNQELDFGPGDSLRTYCPGPSDLDVAGQQEMPIAQGVFTRRAFGEATAAVGLVNHASFSGREYAGAWSGTLAFTLIRLGVRVGVVKSPLPDPVEVQG